MKSKVLTFRNSKSAVNSDTLLKAIALASAIPITLAMFSQRVLAEESPHDQDKRTDQTESLQATGALSIDLGDSNDPLIGAEARDLAERSIEFVQGLDLEHGHILTVRYLGKGRLGNKMRADPPPLAIS